MKLRIDPRWKDKAIIVMYGTGAGFIRLCKDRDGRWSHRWVKLPWFGYKRVIRVRKIADTPEYTKVRKQTITRIWMPYVLAYWAVNTLDTVIFHVPKGRMEVQKEI